MLGNKLSTITILVRVCPPESQVYTGFYATKAPLGYTTIQSLHYNGMIRGDKSWLSITNPLRDLSRMFMRVNRVSFGTIG